MGIVATTPLAGQVVLITGASRGIGAALAVALAAEGAHLCLVARGAADLTRVQAACATAAGERDARCITIVADVTRAADCERIVAQCREVLGGKIDVLCNNAGIAPRGPVANCEPAELAAAIACNVHAPMLLSRLVLPDMLRRGSGTIIHMSSVCAWCCCTTAAHPKSDCLLCLLPAPAWWPSRAWRCTAPPRRR